MKRKNQTTLLVRFFFVLALVCFLSGCTSKTPEPDAANATPAPVVASSTSAPSNPDSGNIHDETPSAKLELTLGSGGVEIQVPWPSGELYRGYKPLQGHPRETRVALDVKNGKALDVKIPSGVTLHYLAISPDKKMSQGYIEIPAQKLPTLHAPELEVDKTHCVLEVREGQTVKKRYPIALGANPVNRKYCQDMASTPEGWYEIYNLQPNATYHRALDVDYPRSIDHLRLQLAVEFGIVEAGRPVGGEIQIHGWGIGANWTAGCMALRDEDMDELFSDPALRAGTKVFIAGSHFRPEDKTWLANPSPEAVKKVQSKLSEAGHYQGAIDGQLGDGTAMALGRYQKKNDLPWSCQLDGQTREHFGLN